MSGIHDTPTKFILRMACGKTEVLNKNSPMFLVTSLQTLCITEYIMRDVLSNRVVFIWPQIHAWLIEIESVNCIQKWKWNNVPNFYFPWLFGTMAWKSTTGIQKCSNFSGLLFFMICKWMNWVSLGLTNKNYGATNVHFLCHLVYWTINCTLNENRNYFYILLYTCHRLKTFKYNLCFTSKRLNYSSIMTYVQEHINYST